MFARLLAGLCLCAGGISSFAMADFLPPNDLGKEDGVIRSSAMTEAEFNEIIDLAERTFGRVISENFDATLKVNRLWSNSTVNASANQRGKTWEVSMYGGLARRPEVTADGFALVLCHEIGHHLGGYPFRSNWAANEGESDYFASMVCPRILWQDQREVNAGFRATVDPLPKQLCDAHWPGASEQNLCYRVMMGGKSTADMAAVLSGTAAAWETPDLSEVKRTDNNHPDGQCRLDTYMAGALCQKEFDLGVIPGKELGWSRNGKEAELEAVKYSCTQYEAFATGYRPRCWFKPSLTLESGVKDKAIFQAL